MANLPLNFLIWTVAMQLTVTIPDELAFRIQAFEEQLPRILELGLRH